MALISKELLLSLPHDVFRGLRGEVEAITINIEDFNKLPDKVDVVEVVRCGECRNADTKKCPIYCAGYGYTDDDFCSCGERK